MTARRLRDVVGSAGPSLAGPLLIVAAVLVAMRGVAFRGLLSVENPDVLALWLPTHCFLGASLASGHVPAWNPHVMAGVPFAADPQSGWMNLPAMALYTLLPCGGALRAYVVLQPVLAGLGLYLFLRSEGLSRPAAALGGLALAVPVAVSRIALSLPFSASLAWTALTLAAASRYLRAGAWPPRLGWLAAAALAWGQLAAAHPSEGFVVGTLALGAYLVGRAAAGVRAGRRPAARFAVLVGLLLVAGVALNLAYLLPRLAYLPRTSIALGYEELRSQMASLTGLRPVERLPGDVFAPQWPLRLSLAPGLYLGAAPLVLSLAWWRSRHRGLAAAFALYGGLCYLLSLGGVARALSGVAGALPFGDFYLKAPAHFGFGLQLAIPILAAVAVHAWGGEPASRARWVLPAVGLAVWGLLPIALGAAAVALVPLAVGGSAAGLALLAARKRSAALLALPVLLAAELVLAEAMVPAQRGPRPPLRPAYVREGPEVSVAAYLRPGAIATGLGDGAGARYLSLDPGRWDPRGYHVHRDPASWPLMAAQRSMVLGLEEAQGYNSTQSVRFWTFVRAADPKRIKYNAGFFTRPPPVALDLLQVGAVIAPAGEPPENALEPPQAREGTYALYAVRNPPPRATLVTAWEVAGSPEEALAAVLAPGFDPSRTAVLESGPGTGPGAGEPGTARYVPLGPQRARVEVDAPVPGLVLVRTSFDPNWRATVDGEKAQVLRADYLIQAVAVPAGRHVVELRYDDPWVGRGLLASAAALLALGGAVLALRRTGGALASGA